MGRTGRRRRGNRRWTNDTIQIISIPNLITILRFIIIPFYTIFLIKERFVLALILFILSALSDILDGYLARKLNQVTSLGKILDPLSDKLIILISLIYFGLNKYLPLILVIIFFLKEILMLLTGLYFLSKRIEIISSRAFGKIATIFTSASVIMILLKIPFTDIIFMIGLAFSLLAGFDYLLIYVKKFRSS
ncbi:MAG: CDP-alcohol phosphatidyltransferase family protein [Dictyoglomaceae bacterium]|nr:CDP-alcohol phosphatidyltransferase family protein [Dictyoglomaceae bacterium]